MNKVGDLDEIDPDSNFFNEFYENFNNFHQPSYLSVDECNQLNTSSEVYFTILNYGVKSFRQNSDCFLSIFNDDYFPNVILLSETWYSTTYQDDIPGYNSFHTFTSNQKSGGVSVSITNINSAENIPALCISNFDIEICTVEVCLDKKALVIISIYMLHSRNIEHFISELNRVYRHRGKRTDPNAREMGHTQGKSLQ